MRLSVDLSVARQMIAICLLVASGVFFSWASDFGDKRVAVLGDSMSWIGGDSCDIERGWTCHFVRRLHPGRMDVYARSGAMWTNASATKGDMEEYTEVITDDNVIYTQVRRLLRRAEEDASARPDIIIIYAGANDAWFSSRRPGMFGGCGKDPLHDSQTPSPGECTSLASSVTLSCRLLKQAFPESRIVAVTPTEISKVAPAEVNKVGDTIEKAASAFGIEVLRADHDVDIRHDVEKKRHRHTSDGVHTNPSGARLIADYITAKLTNNKELKNKE